MLKVDYVDKSGIVAIIPYESMRRRPVFEDLADEGLAF
jgi:hypothetical protein